MQMGQTRMGHSSRYRVMVGAIVGVVLACGAVAAVAATGPGAGHRSARARLTTHHDARRHSTLAVASAYLGVSKAQLRKSLREGKTLAQVAGETSGKSETGLIAALVAAREQRSAAHAASLEQRIRARASAREATLTKRITALVGRRFSAAGSD